MKTPCTTTDDGARRQNTGLENTCPVPRSMAPQVPVPPRRGRSGTAT